MHACRFGTFCSALFVIKIENHTCLNFSGKQCWEEAEPTMLNIHCHNKIVNKIDLLYTSNG